MSRWRLLHSQLRNKQVPCCNYRHLQHTIPPVKKSKQHEKRWKKSDSFQGKTQSMPLVGTLKKGNPPWSLQEKMIEKLGFNNTGCSKRGHKAITALSWSSGRLSKEMGKTTLSACFLSLENTFWHFKLEQPLGHLNWVCGCYEKNWNCVFQVWEKWLFS